MSLHPGIYDVAEQHRTGLLADAKRRRLALLARCCSAVTRFAGNVMCRLRGNHHNETC